MVCSGSFGTGTPHLTLDFGREIDRSSRVSSCFSNVWRYVSGHTARLSAYAFRYHAKPDLLFRSRQGPRRGPLYPFSPSTLLALQDDFFRNSPSGLDNHSLRPSLNLPKRNFQFVSSSQTTSLPVSDAIIFPSPSADFSTCVEA
jgi:hypothetical protein